MIPSHYEPGDRVLVRERPWKVLKVSASGLVAQVLELEACDDDEPRRLSVVVPPDSAERLAGSELELDIKGLESTSTWCALHQLVQASAIRAPELLSGARYGRVAIEAYQLAPTLRLLAKPRPRLLVADDVGLGKTIEAGLAILELAARGLGKRILIVTPPGLLDQWAEELEEKFGLRFTILENAAGLAREQTRLPAGTNPWDTLPRVITSIEYLKKEAIQARALRKRWDLVIVDEAHSLAESGTTINPYRTQRTRLGTRLSECSHGLILLTATPHNGYAHSFRSLLELIEPTLATLQGNRGDLERRIEATRIRRMKAQIHRRLPDGSLEPVFPKRHVAPIPIALAAGVESEIFSKIASYCSRTAREAEGTEDEELVGFAMQILKKRALSSRAALKRTLENRLEALKSKDDPESAPSRSELKELQQELPLEEAAAERTAQRLIRSTIPKEQARREKERKALNAILRLFGKLGSLDPKIEALVSELAQNHRAGEKTIVFTEYRDTLDAIQQRLSGDPELANRCVVLQGGLTRRQRQERQRRFEEPAISVLLATDAASEGLNLQKHCRRVVHFELPWNPNRMEQRNGRVDRYGQSQKPEIRYLLYEQSPEEQVLRQLVEKIERMAEAKVSTPDILGVFSGDETIGRRLVALDPEAADVRQRIQDLVRHFDDRTDEFVREWSPLLASGAKEGELSVDAVERADTVAIEERDLEALGKRMLGDSMQRALGPVEGAYRIDVPYAFRGPGVPALYPAATFRRDVALRHRAEEMEFLTPLHPLLRAMAADARRRLLQVYTGVRGLPPRRLSLRLVSATEPASIVFTFLCRIHAGGVVLEERLLLARVDARLEVLGTTDSCRTWLELPSAAGDAPWGEVERFFSASFAAMRARAAESALNEARIRAEELRQRRSAEVEQWLRHLEVDTRDRLRELQEQAERKMGLIEESTNQRLLFTEEGSASAEIATRRAAVEERASARRAELDSYRSVELLGAPEPLGACILWPAAEKA